MNYKKNWLTSHIVFSLNIRTAMPDMVKNILIKMELISDSFNNLTKVIGITTEQIIKNTEVMWRLLDEGRETSCSKMDNEIL